MKPVQRCLLVLYLLISIVYSQALAQADIKQVSPLLVSLDEGIIFYRINHDGDLQEVGSLPDNFSNHPDTSDWLILDPRFFVVSPSGQQIAFTAQRGTEYGLFIYTLSTRTIKQEIIDSTMQLLWSPDETTIFMTPMHLTVDTATPLPNTVSKIYDPVAETFIQLTQLDNSFFNFQWKSDNSGLLFQRLDPDCLKYCIELFTIDRDGRNVQQLTEMERDAPANLFPLACHPIWAAEEKRVYHVVGCIEVGIYNLDYLYSADTNNVIRQELNFIDPELDVGENKIVSLNSIGDSIYITRQTGYGGSEGSIHWYVSKLNSTQSYLDLVDIIPSTEYHPVLYNSQFSPEASKIALVGLIPPFGVEAHIVNLSTGEVDFTIDASRGQVCEIYWLTETELIYQATDRKCYNGYYDYSQSSYYYVDTVTGQITNVADSIKVPVWVIPTD